MTALLRSSAVVRKGRNSGRLAFLLSRDEVVDGLVVVVGAVVEDAPEFLGLVVSTDEDRRRALERVAFCSVTGLAGGVGSTMGKSRYAEDLRTEDLLGSVEVQLGVGETPRSSCVGAAIAIGERKSGVSGRPHVVDRFKLLVRVERSFLC